MTRTRRLLLAVPRRVSSCLLLLLAGVLVQAPPVAGQEPPLPPKPHLTPEALSRLAQAARDSTLAPWQQEIMREVAGDSMNGVSNKHMSWLSGAAPGSDEMATEDGSWIAIPPPAGRRYHTSIYDPVRNRMVVFGGELGGGPLTIGDVWALSLAGSPTWSVLSPSGGPPSGRWLPTAIYDPVRDRMVVFGGYVHERGRRNDVWALSLSGTPAWSEITPAGSPPSARYAHTAIYDPVRDRMVVFGGQEGGAWPEGVRNDVWELSLSGDPIWSELTPAGDLPTGREAHTAIYDPVRDRMVVFGGLNYLPRSDVWALSLSGTPAWSELSPAGNPPPGRLWHTAIYDPERDRMVVFGGNDFSHHHADAWALSLAGELSWSELTGEENPPSGRYGHTAIYDPARQRMVVFGGYDGNLCNDVWALSLAESPSWSDLTPNLPVRLSHTAVYDPARNRMVVFGGLGNGYGNDVWALSLAESPAWSALAPAGSPPIGRYGHTAIYDPVRDRMVVFGGGDGTYFRNDVWALSLAESPAWSALAPAGSPPIGRYGHTAIYDPVRDRMMVFGGYDGPTLRNDVWELSLSGNSAWSELTPTGAAPTPRVRHTAIYDPVRDRMVVFGGQEGGAWPQGVRNDVWELSLSGDPIWSELTPAGDLPIGRDGHTAIYDPVRDRMVVFGGGGRSGAFNDVWALRWGSPVSDVEMSFDFTPHTLNLTSQGLWVTGFLEPASPFAATDINIASIRLNGTVPVDPLAPTALGDHDDDGVIDLMVKFNRAAVELTVSEGDSVPVTVTGTVAGRSFSGTDYIRVRRAVVSAPAAGSHLLGGTVTEVRWGTTSADTVQSVALLQSFDGGRTWSLIARGQPNTGSYYWAVPNVPTQQAKVAVVLVESADSTGDIVEGVLGVSEAFSIEGVVSVGDRGPTRLAMRGATPNPALDGRLRVEFSLRDGSAATLDVVDVAGRVLRTRQVGGLGPGTHSLDLGKDSALRPGVYFLRLTQGGNEVRARAAVIK